jgi:hypothetical protein
MEAGEYVLEFEMNPARRLPEVSFENNVGRVRVMIQDLDDVSVAKQVETAIFVREAVDDTSRAVSTACGVCYFVLAMILIVQAALE